VLEKIQLYTKPFKQSMTVYRFKGNSFLTICLTSIVMEIDIVHKEIAKSCRLITLSHHDATSHDTTYKCGCQAAFFLMATRVGTAELWLEYIWREVLPFATEVALSPEKKRWCQASVEERRTHIKYQ
jgi:hypothetical protein